MKVFISMEEANEISNPRFVDCRHSLVDPELGKKLFQEDHLPGAIHAHLDKDLSGNISGKNGRHPLPNFESFKNWLEKHALVPSSVIIVYDNFQGGIAARLWFMLSQLYYDKVYILEGNIDQWKDSGNDTESQVTNYTPIELDLPVENWEDGKYRIKKLGEIENEIPSNYLIDSRAPERYKGKEEPYDAVAGRIPGAVNHYWNINLNSEGKLSKDAIHNSPINTGELDQYTVYCGSGVTAAFNLAVFEEFGFPRPSIFVGSYSEWSQNHPENIEKD